MWVIEEVRRTPLHLIIVVDSTSARFNIFKHSGSEWTVPLLLVKTKKKYLSYTYCWKAEIKRDKIEY